MATKQGAFESVFGTFSVRRLENPEDKVNPEDHETYRSGVGTLLYLTKHSRLDICNPVRELSKTMDANRSLPTPGGLMADVPCLDRSLDGC